LSNHSQHRLPTTGLRYAFTDYQTVSGTALDLNLMLIELKLREAEAPKNKFGSATICCCLLATDVMLCGRECGTTKCNCVVFVDWRASELL